MKAIFCFDGTCNDPEDSGDFFEDSSVSNILKIHAFLGGVLNPLNEENAKTSGQRILYYSGIGTRGNWMKQKFKETLIYSVKGYNTDHHLQLHEDLLNASTNASR